jgi:uncharacterized membrane protein (UPF0127 family)
MKLYKIISSDKYPEVLIQFCEELIFAASFSDRLFGLIFKNIKKGQGFIIKDCNSIHTFWMRYKIDVVFLNKNNEIIKLFESFKQFRMTPVIKDACCVIEFPESTINDFSLKIGDNLKFI